MDLGLLDASERGGGRTMRRVSVQTHLINDQASVIN